MKGVLNVRETCTLFSEFDKTMLETYWMREKYVGDVLSARNLCNGCAECEKVIQKLNWM